MERVRQTVSDKGIQIPLPLIQQYGLTPGQEVILEFGPDGVYLLPSVVDAEQIERYALKLLLRKLGDAVQIQVVHNDNSERRQGDDWRVNVYGSDGKLLLGHLAYTQSGEWMPEYSTSFAAMRQVAIEFFAHQ